MTLNYNPEKKKSKYQVLQSRPPQTSFLEILKFYIQVGRRASARSTGFSWIKKIPYQAPATQLGPHKMYILEKRIFGT